MARATYWIAKNFVKIPNVSLANIIAEGEVVPEFLQDGYQPANVAAALTGLLDEGPARTAQLEGYAAIRDRFDEVPSAGAGALVLEAIR